VGADDLSSVTEQLTNPGYREVLGAGDVARGEVEPELGEEIRSLLIMTQCVARWMGTYWDVRRLSGIDQPRDWVPPRPGIKWRALTGVAANASFEEWREALNSFAGGLGK
jgi:hypothetical protein